MKINWFDIVVLIPACWFGFKGLKNGLIKELVSLLALVLGVWATFRFSDQVAALFGDVEWANIIAFIVIFLAVLILTFLIGKIVEKIITFVVPALFNNLLGLCFGLAKVFIVFAAILYFTETLDPKGVVIKSDVKERSLFYRYYSKAIQTVSIQFPNLIPHT